MAKDDKYTDILLEEIRSQMGAVLEIVSSMQENVKHIPVMREDIADLKSDVAVIKAAVKDTNHDLKFLERRVDRLEHQTV